MNKYAERRNIMVDLNNFAISVEELASYFDDNVSSDEANRIEDLVSSEPELSEIMSVSKEVDADMQDYINDEFVFDTEMSMLDEMNIEIPDVDSFPDEYTDSESTSSSDDVFIEDINTNDISPFDNPDSNDDVTAVTVGNDDDAIVQADEPQSSLQTYDESDPFEQDSSRLDKNNDFFSER